MTQYMLSVHHREGDPEVSDEDMQKAFKAVDAFNTKIRPRPASGCSAAA